jgi:ABC-type arginine transport system ATPase subunit
MSVFVEVDARKFPMEIAKSMLSLGQDLALATGPAGYFEAFNRLQVYLETLTKYHDTLWPNKHLDFTKQKTFAEKFIQMHRWNKNLVESQARQLLDSLHFFPVADEYPYQEKMDQDEYKGY